MTIIMSRSLKKMEATMKQLVTRSSVKEDLPLDDPLTFQQMDLRLSLVIIASTVKKVKYVCTIPFHLRRR